MWLLGLAPLRAHHSMAMYEQKNITISGIVKRVDLRNPHSLFYITVTDAQGKQVEWVLEAQPLSHAGGQRMVGDDDESWRSR